MKNGNNSDELDLAAFQRKFMRLCKRFGGDQAIIGLDDQLARRLGYRLPFNLVVELAEKALSDIEKGKAFDAEAAIKGLRKMSQADLNAMVDKALMDWVKAHPGETRRFLMSRYFACPKEYERR